MLVDILFIQLLVQFNRTCVATPSCITDQRELADLERRYQLLHNDHNSVKKQLADKDARLVQLQTGEQKAK
jgi:predicted  nucleic acid-binding Zn-ribbon protein